MLLRPSRGWHQALDMLAINISSLRDDASCLLPPAVCGLPPDTPSLTVGLLPTDSRRKGFTLLQRLPEPR